MKRFLLITFILVMTTALFADEGMWTFDNPPKKQLKEKYNFEPTQEWLDHVRLASVRFNDGGSGSFISADGLVLTNHHVARGQLQKLSTAEHNYIQDGFYAATMAEEIKTADLELNILYEMEDVTEIVLGAVDEDMDFQEALAARKAIRAKLEKESLGNTGLRSDVVSLYHGGEYWIYRYKKYTDVRIAFAPEVQAAYFGGDFDNFTYPRYDLDFAIFRVYEDGKPVHPKAFLKWNSTGAAKDELVFVSGNPGSTSRQHTYAQLVLQRDFSYPYRVKRYSRMLGILEKYAAQDPEQARQAQGMMFGLNNALKAWGGEYKGLLDEDLMAKKKADEDDFREKIAANPEWKNKYGTALAEIDQSQQTYMSFIKPYLHTSVRASKLARYAGQIITYVAEIQKPDAERLNGYHDAQLERVKFYMLSPAPVYVEMDKVLLQDHMELALAEMGRDDEFVQIVLGDKSPKEAVAALLDNTKMADPEFRKSLLEGGKEAVDNSEDPLIVLARKLDPLSRSLKKKYEEKVESIAASAQERLAEARFKIFGRSVYPDATFTLRLSYGTVTGFKMNGTIAPPFTTLYGLFDRTYSFEQQPPFDVPAKIMAKKDVLDLTTRVNFVATCDIIGGNSGSPVINSKGELVGLVFDGNIDSLVGRYVYDITLNRAVSVHTAYMMEVLRKVYGAGKLADEIVGK